MGDLTAEQKLSFQNDLVQMVVHDLKGALMEISANIDLLVNSAEISETDREFAKTALDGSNDLYEMIMDMLSLGKMEAGALKLEKSRVNMGEIAEREIRKLAQTTDDKNMAIHIKKEGILEVNADEKLIGRVIANFLSNGLKYSPPGNDLSVTVKEEGDFVKILFRDKGPGVPPEYGERVYDKYVQVEMRTHKRKGATGLGLPYCRMAVEAHSGQVGLNNVDPGSEFYFIIPKDG
jgi:K+-sensing histidine kinase KdpD